jgi:hypothetical protein
MHARGAHVGKVIELDDLLNLKLTRGTAGQQFILPRKLEDEKEIMEGIIIVKRAREGVGGREEY